MRMIRTLHKDYTLGKYRWSISAVLVVTTVYQ